MSVPLFFVSESQVINLAEVEMIDGDTIYFKSGENRRYKGDVKILFKTLLEHFEKEKICVTPVLGVDESAYNTPPTITKATGVPGAPYKKRNRRRVDSPPAWPDLSQYMNEHTPSVLTQRNN